MDRINFIPKQRRLVRERRVRIQMWVGIVVSYAAAVLLVGLTYAAIVAPFDMAALDDKHAEHQSEKIALQKRREALAPQLDERRLILTANHSITDQPDWSRLLAYLADKIIDDSIVLTRCSLETEAAIDKAEDYNTTTMVLAISGYAKTTPDVSQFILRLEQMSLFESVTLVNTNFQRYMDADAIVFEARCVLDPGTGGGDE